MSTRDQAQATIDKAMEWFAKDKISDEAAVLAGSFVIEVAQAQATLYVGDQLARIADMISHGFKAERDDYGRTGVYPERPSS